MKKRHKKTKAETTKIIVTMILGVSLIDLQFSYLLAFLGKDPLENVALSLIKEVILVFLGYSLKAFFGKKEEEITRLKEIQMEMEQKIRELKLQLGIKEEEEEDDN